jgi:EAL domain-containing protein (putative c-di-GMP-specific phosphodiesterase class I)
MLKELPVDRIKLDMHFLTGSGDQARSGIIVGHVIHLAHALGTDIIAEGVEDEGQAAFLCREGCPEMQGYFFYKPMPLEEFEQLG